MVDERVGSGLNRSSVEIVIGGEVMVPERIPERKNSMLKRNRYGSRVKFVSQDRWGSEHVGSARDHENGGRRRYGGSERCDQSRRITRVMVDQRKNGLSMSSRSHCSCQSRSRSDQSKAGSRGRVTGETETRPNRIE